MKDPREQILCCNCDIDSDYSEMTVCTDCDKIFCDACISWVKYPDDPPNGDWYCEECLKAAADEAETNG